ncbi:hypothetical protein ACFLSW_01390 [Candidatus Bipolaricaulota bacterium]
MRLGDSFSRIKKSKIINRSTIVKKSSLQNALNRMSEESDRALQEALVELAEIVANSGEADAGKLLDSFNEELATETPRKPVLQSLWDGMTKAVPAILAAAKIAETISRLLL